MELGHGLILALTFRLTLYISQSTAIDLKRNARQAAWASQPGLMHQAYGKHKR